MTLLDGRLVPSDSEEWRQECEARAVLKMPLGLRKQYLGIVEKKRGLPERQRVQGLVERLWIIQRADEFVHLDQNDLEHRMHAIELAAGIRVVARIRERIKQLHQAETDLFTATEGAL